MFPPEKISQKIYDEIVAIVLNEEAILKDLSKGIFFMPELALSYQVGLSLLQNQNKIFGNNGWDAERELKIDDLGPTDLVLINSSENKKILFEFKIRGTYDSYSADIDKLNRQKSENYVKYFCVLVDAFAKDNLNDKRLRQVNTKYKDLIIWQPKEIQYFTTHYTGYQQQIVCVIAFWQIR